MRKRLLRLLERKHPIDDRLQLVHRDCPVHFLEHLAIADEDAVQAARLVHQRKGTGIAVAAGHEANQTDFPATRKRANRSRQRPYPADLDDAIDATAGRQRPDFLLPFRRALVIHNI